MSGVYPIAAYAARLPEGQRDIFALFAHWVPADTLQGFLRANGRRKDDLPACPKWFWARPRAV